VTSAPLRTTPWGAAVWTGIAVGLLCLALAPGAIDNIDTRIAFRSAQSVLSRGTFALETPTQLELALLWTGEGLDGGVYSKFGAGLSVTLLPFVLVGRLLAGMVGIESAQLEELAASLSSAVFTAIAAALLVKICRDHLGVSARAAVVGTLAWALGTFQFAHSGSSYLETPLALCVVGAAWAGLTARRSDHWVFPVLCGAFAGWAVAIKIALIVYLPFLLIPLLTRDRRSLTRRAVLAGLPLAVIAGWLLLLNQLRYGSPFSTGYVGFGTLFETPLLVGLAGYAFDPDIALPLFAPAFVIGLCGCRELLARAPLLFWSAVGVFVSGTVIHALHTGYHGGTCYGPRYLISAIPLLTAPGVALLWDRVRVPARTAFGLALGLCVLVQIPGVLISTLEYHTLRGAVRERGMPLDAISPRFPVDWQLLGRKLGGDAERYDLADFIDDPALVPEQRDYEVPRMDRGLSVWWLQAAREGRRVALVPGLLLLLGAAGAGVVLARRLASDA